MNMPGHPSNYLPLVLAIVLHAPLGAATLPRINPIDASRCDEDNLPVERRVIDDMEDVGDWHNYTPEQSSISSSNRYVKQGGFSLEFANVIGRSEDKQKKSSVWPRTAKRLRKSESVDWTDYDYFECWVYATTSREALPEYPIAIVFYTLRPNISFDIELAQIGMGRWTKIRIPLAQIQFGGDVERIQFCLPSRNYDDGDRVNFYIDDIALVRYAHPVIKSLSARRRLVYVSERCLIADYSLVGNRSDKVTSVVLEIGQGNLLHAKTSIAAADVREELAIEISADHLLRPGPSWMRLSIQDREGRCLHVKESTFRVIEGPFE